MAKGGNNMKATGIVRSIDDLGRVVIPKEIRRTLKIREGDPLEIFVQDGGVFYKKYSPVGELGDFAQDYADSLCETTGGHICIITDRDAILSVSGISKREFMGKSVSKKLEEIMNNRGLYQYLNNKGVINITEDQELKLISITVCPIITEGDIVGSVILASSDPNVAMGEIENKLVKSAALFLGKQMES